MVVVLVHRPEHRDDRVADVLLDQAPRRADLSRDRIPGVAHVLVELLGIEPLGEGREPRDVGEEDRDLASLALDLASGGEAVAALAAVRVLRGHARAALRARHVRSPGHRRSEPTAWPGARECRPRLYSPARRRWRSTSSGGRTSRKVNQMARS